MKKRKSLQENPVPISLENFRRWMQSYVLSHKDKLNDYDLILQSASLYFMIPITFRFDTPHEWYQRFRYTRNESIYSYPTIPLQRLVDFFFW